MADHRKFWMVAGDGPSRARHASQRDAEREAERLARTNPGISFFVMEAIAVHRKVDVERINLREGATDDEIPF